MKSHYLLFVFMAIGHSFGRNCSYDLIVSISSNFSNSLTVNSLGYPQGSDPLNPVTQYALDPSGDGSASFIFGNKNQKWFFDLCPSSQNSSVACVGAQSFDAIHVVIKNFTKFGFEPETQIFSTNLVNTKFNYAVSSKMMDVNSLNEAAILIHTDVNAQSATRLEVSADIGLVGKTVSIKEISLVRIKPICLPQPKAKKGFVHVKDQILMLDEKPFRYVGFYVPTILNSSKIEQEDLVKTVALFGGDGIKAIETPPVLKVKGDRGCGEQDSLILGKNVYNEKILQNLDQLLVLARTYKVKILIPFVHWANSLSTFAVMYGSEAHKFYTDPKLLQPLFSVMDLILNRTNTLNGIPYKEDDTIMGWSYGIRLVETDLFSSPSRKWCESVAIHILSRDPNHLIFDGKSYYDNILLLMDPYTDVIGFDINTCDRNWLYFLKSLAKILGQPVQVPLLASCAPNLLIPFLEEAYGELVVGDGFGTSLFSGVFVRFLAGRKAKVGFDLFHDFETNYSPLPGLHYPGFVFDDNAKGFELQGSSAEKLESLESVAYNLYRVYANNGEKVSWESYERPIMDPPTIISAVQTGYTIEIEFFGSVGATSYDILKSRDNKTFTPFGASDIIEVDGTLITDVSSEYKTTKCSFTVFYKIVAKFDQKISLPGYFSVPIAVPNEPSECKKSALITASAKPESDFLQANAILLIMCVFIFAISVVSALIFICNRRRIKRRQKSSFNALPRTNLSKEANISLTFSLNGQHRELAVPGYMKLNMALDLSYDESDKFQERGHGYSAKVIKGQLKSEFLIEKFGNISVAVKLMTNDDDDYLFEVALMSYLPSSPHIVKLIGYSDNPKAIVMKYYQISLKILLKSLETMEDSPFLRLKIGADIAKGMNIIHSHGILHLDLKPHNVLVEIFKDGSFVCAICDFGFSNIIGNTHKNGIVSGLLSPQTAGLTARYASPELLDSIETITSRFNREEDKKIDVYAYAITLYEVLFGIEAWKNTEFAVIRNLVLSGQRQIITDEMKSTYSSFNPIIDEVIVKGWDQDPLKRPDFVTILALFEKLCLYDSASNSLEATSSISSKILQSTQTS